MISKDSEVAAFEQNLIAFDAHDDVVCFFDHCAPRRVCSSREGT